jgi:hypothetical protein
MTEENALTIYDFQPASNSDLAGALIGIRAQIEAAARANLNVAMQEDGGFTETEQMAMLKIESLRQVNGLDLAAILLRAEYLQEIQNNNLITIHPAGYGSLRDMARDQGISEAELSQTLDLANVVFPYVEDVLDIRIPILWEQIGKSNMRELVPVLKHIITGEDANAASVNDAVARILEDVQITFQASDQPELADDDELVQRTAIEQLLDQGMTLTNRELRHHIRPERTPSAEVTTFSTPDDTIVIAAELTADQWEVFMRKMGQYADPMPFIAANDPAQRQREALQIRALRRILDVIGGT